MPETVDIGGVACKFRQSSGVKGKVDPQRGQTESVEIHCPWAQRQTVIKALAGYSKLDEDGNVVYVDPFKHPDIPELQVIALPSYLGMGRDRRSANGYLEYDEFQIACEFGIPIFGQSGASDPGDDPTGKPYTTTTIQFNAEMIIPKSGTYKWAQYALAGTPVNEGSIGIAVPHMQITIKRHMMPTIPVDLIMEHIGKINEFEVEFAGHVFDGGHLLFVGCGANITLDTLGERRYEVDYILAGQKVHSWNNFLDPDGNWNLVTEDGLDSFDPEEYPGGRAPFKYSNFWYELP